MDFASFRRDASLLLLLLLLVGCRENQLARCLEEEAHGNFTFNTNNACGCIRALCTAGTLCVSGRCCDPAKEDCGCQQTCPDNQVCINGGCCDPGSASDPVQCGCGRACSYWEDCASDGSVYSCQCRQERASDPSDCGCERPDPQKCSAANERCGKESAHGPYMCLCDVSKSENLARPYNCGCRMRCPYDDKSKEFTATCQGGLCRCRNSNESLCAVLDDQGKPRQDEQGRAIYECKPEGECRCNSANPPDFSLYDANNCGCQGPCLPGQKCTPCELGDTSPSCAGKTPGKAAKCGCDPLSHANDNNQCGCGSQCKVEIGEICQGGVCVCNPANLNNSVMCGCNPNPELRVCDTRVPPTGKGESCQSGVCVCDSRLHSVDDKNCGCQGPCPASPGPYRCQAGACLATPH